MLALIVLVACESRQAQLPVKKTSSLDPEQEIPVSRLTLVASANKLALEASQKNGEEAARLFEKSALVRERSFRTFGKKVDALEALELWSDAAGVAEAENCNYGLRLVNLGAQLGASPENQYRDYYLLREKYSEGECRARISRSLTILSNYEPSVDVLRELRMHAHDTNSRDSSTKKVVHQSINHSVVVPEVLSASLRNPTKITKIESFGAERTARIVVHVTHPTKFQVGELPQTSTMGPRIYVDIDHATFEGPSLIEASGMVRGVRLGEKKDKTRVVLDLNEKARYRVFYLPEPFRLIVDLSLELGNERANQRKMQRIVLDPGHGGHDPGAVGPNGLREKDVALDIAHRAAPLLAREVGVSTLLTRDVDTYVALDERAARANAFHADLFVSIHLNSSEDSRSKGVMTFVLDTSRDATASKIAARENSSTEAAAAELANSLSRIESEGRRAASETFAKLLQRAAGVSLRQRFEDVEDHGVRRAGFYVLAGAAMPAVLFEGSFISNPLESRRLNSEAYRQRLADAVVNAVRAYRDGL